MAKISELSDGGSLLPTDYLIAVRSGGNVKVQADTINVDQIDLGDNERIRLGDSQDLQIYHDGSNSYIQDEGTGGLIISSDGPAVYIQKGTTETSAEFNTDGAVKLRYDNVTKFATTATGIDVTGTVTADGLTVDGATDGTAVALLRADNTGITKKNTLRFEDTDTTTQNDQQIGRIEFYSNDTEHTGVDAVIEAVSGTNGLKELRFLTSETANTPLSRLAIKGRGDISFYEDTGTTAKFFWDASAESLGIGVSSPTGLLTLGTGTFSAAAANTSALYTSATAGLVAVADGLLLVDRAGADVFKVDTSGNVGIGTSSPNAALDVLGSTGDQLRLRTAETEEYQIGRNASTGLLDFYGSQTGFTGYTFGGVDGERMRIDSNGNLLVGTTSASIYNDTSGNGIQLNGGSGQIVVAKESSSASDPALWLNNTGVDGSIVTFAKDGALVGSIGSASGVSVYIHGGTGYSGLTFGNDELNPCDETGANRDAQIDLGDSLARFKDLYLSNSMLLSNATTSSFMQVSSNVLQFGTSSNDPVAFYSNNAEAMRLDASGNLLVGTNTVNGKINFQGDGTSTAYTLVCTDSAGNGTFQVRDDGLINTGLSTASLYNLTTANAANVHVLSNGTLYRSTSSERYKNTIQNATHGLTELLTLRPVTYKGNDDGDLVFGGLIAEEVHDAGLTEFVQYNEENQPDALAYGNMVSLCIKAIQEQQDLIESLTARIAQLEGAN